MDCVKLWAVFAFLKLVSAARNAVNQFNLVQKHTYILKLFLSFKTSFFVAYLWINIQDMLHNRRLIPELQLQAKLFSGQEVVFR